MRRLTWQSITTTCWRLRSLVLGVVLVATSAAWLAERRPESSSIAKSIRTETLVAQLDDVPSHNRRYRATLEPELNEKGQLVDWRMLITTADGSVPTRPTLVMRSWMPETPSVVGDRPKASYLGDGTFRVEGLRFRRPGWWNVTVTISDAAVTDSLAFNLIVP
jgi:hypothetical protein